MAGESFAWRTSSFSGGGDCVEVAPGWFKSSRSTSGACVEVSPRWRKSTASATDVTCVEVAPLPDMVLVRDSKDRAGGHLTVDRVAFKDFVGAVAAGEFNDWGDEAMPTKWRKASGSTTNATCVEVARDGDEYLVRDGKDPAGPVLRYTTAEWQAFTAGVKADEFNF